MKRKSAAAVLAGCVLSLGCMTGMAEEEVVVQIDRGNPVTTAVGQEQTVSGIVIDGQMLPAASEESGEPAETEAQKQPEEPAETGAQEQSEKKELYVETQDCYLDPAETSDITVQYGRILVAQDGYDALKKALDEWNQQRKEQCIQDVEGLEDTAASGDGSYTIERRISPARADETVFSYWENFYSYTGGVHPFYSSTGMTLDSKTGRRLSLSEVVSDYDRLYQLILEKISPNAQGYYDDYEDIIRQAFYENKDDDGTLTWLLDEEGLQILFNPYAIGCYATGPTQVTFSYEEYRDLILPEYQREDTGFVMELEQYDYKKADLDGDGVEEEISVTATADEENYKTWAYFQWGDHQCDISEYGDFRKAFLIRNKEGQYYLYAQYYAENDIGYLYCYRFENGDFVRIGQLEGRSVENILSPDAFLLWERVNVLSTYNAWQKARLGADGMPELTDTVYHRACMEKEDRMKIQSVRELSVTRCDEDGKMEREPITLPAGTEFYPEKTDNETYVDLRLEDDSLVRLSITKKEWTWEIDGVSEYDCFEMLYYAG